MRWQHRVPQGSEEMHEEEVEPRWVRTPTGVPTYHRVCMTCGKPVVEVDDNEGPEALKALFKF